ncbi:uncharacterized protein LOC128740870 [Sabethes cyaneus]|uniref:uncharacterized protein LOC128740870 n=1 Tax=Sabethes cyaneus TaxID=53552 RepID=UPI00237DD8E4|nr:uncharacterized protein LOC128740870 [Sabethes cyaneus]
MEETTRRVCNRFETGLIWKSDNIEFPNSYPMAVRRLEALERKLAKDPALRARVHEQLDEYVAKGYCHRATPSELAATDIKRVWYLPLGIVVNPRKPAKVRLVWDAAAQVNGVSFNSVLLKGPDLLTPLVAVLSHFREHEIARKNSGETPQIYVIDVATFGSTCSPSSAQFVKNLNAKEHMEEFPRAATAIIKYHYVDAYLDSFATVEEAIEVVKQVKHIHARGGFEIRNFLSNSEQVLSAIKDASPNESKELSIVRAEKTKSVLGMRWNPYDDVFSYAFSPKEEIMAIMDPTHIPTKREMLKLVMSLFDPLGFITFFLIHGRILIQDAWAAGLGWDTPVNERLLGKWTLWLNKFSALNTLRIPRSYFTHKVDEPKQLHVFVDASKEAYACVAYIRAMGPNGIEVAMVAAKSKVAPIKVLSVPRLELKAAVLGTRLASSVESSHSFRFDRKYFWSDSKTVLACINSDHRKYHQFVGVRIGEILTSTRMNEWRYVRSGQNPADPATKWGAGPNFDLGSLWFRGPTFLYDPEETWPENRSFTTATELTSAQHSHWRAPPPLIDVSRFSKWERLLRSQAYVIRFIENLKRLKSGKSVYSGILTQEELQRAEKLLWKQAQTEVFEVERRTLLETQGGPNARHNLVLKSSPIHKLWPYLDEDGLLRMRGRIGAAWYAPYEAKYPVILPDTHLISYLLTDWFHRRYRHAYHETIVNEMRQQFEIPKLRVLVKKVAKHCLTCRLAKANPRPPPMAPLPKQRLTPYVRPFTYVGVDYFGPLFVKVGRQVVKRWVALFTCMTVRAIHLEVVHNLSTESFVMAVRRFIARRGAPAEFFSDNGTCFGGANKQLQNEIQSRSDALATTFTNANTRWNFNPPGAPHMGGVWERLVRSVKQAIGTIIDSPRKPNDETLATVLSDTESMINSRPLTYVPLETADKESLTPNHFLLGSSSGVKQPPAAPVDHRAVLRSSWNLA